MYYTLVKSALFGYRNNKKVLNTSDKGRVCAEVGQFSNAVKAATKLDNAIGKGTKAAVGAMCSLSKSSKALEYAGKGVDWASKNVNPLLVGAAGYRVVTANDKETALKRELCGMGMMFGVENYMKHLFNTTAYKNFVDSISSKTLKALVGIAQGLVFVAGSITGSTLGYKIGEICFKKKEKNSNKTVITESVKDLKAQTQSDTPAFLKLNSGKMIA